MTGAHRPNYLSLAVHGAFKPGKPCLVSGFVMDGNDQKISPVFEAWATFTPVSDPPRPRGRREEVLRKCAVLLADWCWRDRGFRGEAADKKLSAYFHGDPRKLKKDIARAKEILPHGLFLAGHGETPQGRRSFAFLFDGTPSVRPESVTPALRLTGPAYHWGEPARDAVYLPEITIQVSMASRIALDNLAVTFTDMSRIPAKLR